VVAVTGDAGRWPRGTVRVVDSHTEGEPTRVVIDGGPELGDGPLAGRRDALRDRYDAFRCAVVGEPRGTEGMVGALLGPPEVPGHTAGVVFFDRARYLGMCGHGTIGLVATLAHLGRIRPGAAEIDTPVGAVPVELLPDGRVTVWNVPSRRTRADVSLDVPGFGRVAGDVAWGGNWFFLVDRAPVALRRSNADALLDYCRAIRAALARDRITGDGGEPIDHVELNGAPERPENHGRNFVLTPDGTYDRSPCGTGTSAKVACLVADGRLAPGATWRQEGILGGVFEAVAEPLALGIRPRLTGSAHVTGEATLHFETDDPFRGGIGP
jgi:4-hydroxyproline epimerase